MYLVLYTNQVKNEQLVNLYFFVPLSDTQSTPATGSSLDDHLYLQSTSSFGEINE